MTNNCVSINEYLSVMLGYDDHISVYIITRATAEKLQGNDRVDELNDIVVDEGQYIDAGINYEPDVFLDVSGKDATDFLDQLATALVEDAE